MKFDDGIGRCSTFKPEHAALFQKTKGVYNEGLRSLHYSA